MGPRDPVFQAHPALARELDRLCTVAPWCAAGSSALVMAGGGLLLEIAKPDHWRRTSEGVLQVGLGAVGGSLEGDETLLECLQREGQEELSTRLVVHNAPETAVVAGPGAAARLRLEGHSQQPAPALLTLGPNRTRRKEIDAPTLVIATWWAEPRGRMARADLFGTLWLPGECWPELLLRLPLGVAELRAAPGLILETAEALPEHAALVPGWVVGTLQQALRLGWCPSSPLS
ncbi:MAG: hypothetical protein ACOX2L_09255 [Anaerolineae bacterium]|jgi:8-oxo-dGTP pyrophosphatase MutT (NUDIX family)|nr:hypothetical protein [Chloroflexota bacterium]